MTGDRGEPRADAGGAGDGAYEGILGRTRTETVQVWMPDDTVCSLPVYVAVDAVTDPELARRARNGTLHQVAEGIELAVPYVYHDRTLSLLVLVVPEALRHRALAVRAEHMALLASDATSAVPAYARDVELVVGTAGLNARLDPSRSQPPVRASVPLDLGLTQALRERERELDRRERLLNAREQALRTVPPAFRPVDADNSLYADELTYGEEEADDDEFEEVEELEDDVVLSADEDVSDYDAVSASDLPSEAVTHALMLEDGEAFDVGYGSPSIPAWFADDPSQDLCLTLSRGRPWLIVRGIEAWAGSDIDLLVHLARDTVAPVVLLTLVSATDDSYDVLRSAIDHDDPEQRAALNAVAEHFEVEVAAWAADGALEHLATVMAPRERNVRAILSHLEQNPSADRALWEVARSHALSSPPSDGREHPFQEGVTREPPRTATEAAVMLDDVAEWLTPERQKLLLLTLCVPDAVIEANVREVVAYAVDWGLSLPPHVAARALELGLEKDEAALLLRRIEGLCRASSAEDQGGLEESVLRAMWSEALEQAARLGVALSDEARDMAQKHAGERALVHAAALSDPHDQALEPLRARALRGEVPDPDAMIELSARGAYRDLLAVCRVTEQLEVEQAARVFVHVARRNDPVALDALLSLLSIAEAPRVRLGAALALASRHAVAAIDELCRHAAHAPEPEWRPFARALGRYGAGSFRAITRALAHEAASDDRAAEVQAHLALHGARAQVRAKARVRDGKEAAVAQRALSRAAELREGKNLDPALEQQDPLTVFCQGFDLFLRDVPS